MRRAPSERENARAAAATSSAKRDERLGRPRPVEPVPAGARGQRGLACALAIGLVGLLPASASAALSFGPPTSFPAGAQPRSVVVADFNGDGIPDVAVGNGGYGSGSVSVVLGTGSGAFGAPITAALPGGAISLAVGDFNGDGRPDIAVTSSSFFMTSTTVSVLLGTGTGSFTAAANLTAGSNPYGIAVGDFNGDGKADLAVANQGSGDVSVLLGAGDGSFGAATRFLAAGNPLAVTTGDFNHDGSLDLAVTIAGSPGGVSVLLGDGAGSFGTATIYPVGADPFAVAVGDFNGDGNLDLATANVSSNNISVIIGTGAGSFGPPTNFSAGVNPGSLKVGDFNGDGRPDLVTTDAGNAGGDVAVLLGRGSGSFGAPTSFPANASASSIAVGDFNADGFPDLAVTNGNSSTVSMLLHTAATDDASPTALTFGSAGAPIAQGTLSAPRSVSLTNNGTAPLVVAGFVFGGLNPDDFTTDSDTCRAALEPGASCTVQVRFAPQAQGARAATLTVLANAPTNTTISLQGVAGPLPQGPIGATGQTGAAGTPGADGAGGTAGVTGQPGANGLPGATGAAGTTGTQGPGGPAGATGTQGAVGATGTAGPGGADGQRGRPGARGPRGRAGRIRLVTCTAATARRPRRCTTRLLSSPVTLAMVGTARASLLRGGVVYATGTATSSGLLLHAHRGVLPGRYTLRLRYGHARTKITATAQIAIG